MFLRKESNGFWYIYYDSETGKRNKKSTKTKNSREANEEFSKFRKQTEGKTFRKIIPITLTEFAEKIRDYKAIETSKEYAETFEKLFLDFSKALGNKKVCDLEREDIESFNMSLIGKYKQGTIKQKMAMIKTALSWAAENRFIQRGFYFKSIKMRTVNVEKPFFTKQQYYSLICACKDRDLKDIISVAYMTGMRRREIMKLKWHQVNLESRQIKLDNKVFLTKNRKTGTIPLSDDAIGILKSRYIKRSCDYVFTYKEKPWTEHLYTLYKRLVRKIFGEDTDYTFHSLRHSFVTNLLYENVGLVIVSRLARHSSIKITADKYGHLIPDNRQDIVNKLNIKGMLIENTN